MWNYVMVGWEGGDCSGKFLWILSFSCQWCHYLLVQISAQRCRCFTWFSVAVLDASLNLSSRSFSIFSVATCGTIWQSMIWKFLLWRFHQMICWLYFSLMLVDFHFWQGRLGCTFAAVHRFEINITGWLDWLLSTIIFYIWRFGSYSVEVPPDPTLFLHRVGCGRSSRTTLQKFRGELQEFNGLTIFSFGLDCNGNFSGGFTAKKFWPWRWVQSAVCTTYRRASMVRVSTS